MSRADEGEHEFEFLRTKTRRGRPCGDGAFLKRAERIAGRGRRRDKLSPGRYFTTAVRGAMDPLPLGSPL